MPMQVSTLDILIEKAHFEPTVARAVAEAIENETSGNQLVTVPVLDARLAELKGAVDSRFNDIESWFDSRFNVLEVKMESQKAELVRWVFTAMVAQTATVIGFTYALQHLR
jgi:hypothetical protein